MLSKDQLQPVFSSNDDNDYVRLHVSPLDPELLSIVVPPSVLPRARNVSYHTLVTFPERRYGFVELPRADAERLKAKLNGATLKGHKMRVGKARSEKKVEPHHGEDSIETTGRENERKSDVDGDIARESNGDIGVVGGVALTDRKVKRGWTEVADTQPAKKRRSKSEKEKEAEKKDKKRVKSKYTDGEECLLRMKIRSGAAQNLPEDDALSKKRKKNKDKDREVTVHEFEKTTKFPSFLKDTTTGGSKPAIEFVEGKGWVDDEGAIVEAASRSKPLPKPAKESGEKTLTPEPTAKKVDEHDAASSSSSSGGGSDTSSSETSDDEDEEDVALARQQKPEPKSVDDDDDDDSSNEASSDACSDEDQGKEDRPKTPPTETPTSATKSGTLRPVSSSSSRSLTIKIPAITPTSESSSSKKAVHPLEALYKRNKDGAKTDDAAAEPFSFFGGDDDTNSNNDDDDDDNNEMVEEHEVEQDLPITHLATPMPMTPFTKQEFERRILRSAAPTPDTAHPSRMANFWPTPQAEEEEKEEEEEDEEMNDADLDGGADEDNNPKDPDAPADKSTGDFQSWFWENRRDLNRSWMSRRKAVAKEKRHRENKARAPKAV